MSLHAPAGTPALVVPNVTLRPATLDDTASLSNIHEQAVRILCGPTLTTKQTEAWIERCKESDFAHHISGPEFFCQVAEIDNTAAGFMIGRDNELLKLFTLPDFAGQHKIGSQLLTAFEKHVGKRHNHAVVDASKFATPFYAKRGYIPVRLLHHDMPNGAHIESLWMEKPLPGSSVSALALRQKGILERTR